MEQDQQRIMFSDFTTVLVTIRGKNTPDFAWRQATWQVRSEKSADLPTGHMVVDEGGRDVSCVELLDVLQECGLTLDQLHKRLDYSEMSNKSTPLLRYVFTKRLACEDSLQALRILDELRDWFAVNMWTCKVFVNPKNDGKLLSIELSGRNPLYETDGSPRKVWNKDSAGERVGDAPVILTAKLLLTAENDELIIAEIQSSPA